MDNFFFRVNVDSGNRWGTGHLWRTIKIYKKIKNKYKKRFNYIFLVNNLFYAKKIISLNTKEKIVIYKFNLNKLRLKNSDFFLFDTLGVEKKLAKKFRNKNFLNTISLEDLNQHDLQKKLIINGIYFAKKKLISKNKKIKIYQGIKYIILDKEFSKKKIIKNQKNQKIFKIFICSGGTDTKSFLYKISNAIKNISNIKIYLVIGLGIKRNNLVYRFSKNKKFTFIINKKNLIKYMSISNLNIVSGGIVMFESVCSGKETIVYRNVNGQKYAINFFHKKKLIKYFGKIEDFNKEVLLKYIIKKKLKNFKNKKNNLIDGRGIHRVLKVITHFVNI